MAEAVWKKFRAIKLKFIPADATTLLTGYSRQSRKAFRIVLPTYSPTPPKIGIPTTPKRAISTQRPLSAAAL